jgi:hypothetical protein
MRLLDRLKAPGRNAHSIGLAHSADLTPRITRRPKRRPEHDNRRVGGRVHALVRPPSAGNIQPAPPSHFTTRASRPTTLNSERYNAADNAPPHLRLIRATLWAVACIRLLDRRLIQSFNPRDLNTRNTRSDFLLFIRSVSNARHHPRPHSMCMRGSVMGRRVHAVVRCFSDRSPQLPGFVTTLAPKKKTYGDTYE